MMIRDLIYFLQACNRDAEVLLMTQRKDPHENHLAGVVTRMEMADHPERYQAGMGHDDVFLVVGKRIRRGSADAWRCVEQSGELTQPTPTTVCSAITDEARGDILTAIARDYLRIDTLEERGEDSLDVRPVRVGFLGCALDAAYHAGVAAGLLHRGGDTAAPHQDR